MTGERPLQRAEAANVIKIADALGIHPRELLKEKPPSDASA